MHLVPHPQEVPQLERLTGSAKPWLVGLPGRKRTNERNPGVALPATMEAAVLSGAPGEVFLGDSLPRGKALI